LGVLVNELVVAIFVLGWFVWPHFLDDVRGLTHLFGLLLELVLHTLLGTD